MEKSKMTKTRGLLALLPGMLLALCIIACPGNGGTSDFDDDAYTPGVGGWGYS